MFLIEPVHAPRVIEDERHETNDRTLLCEPEAEVEPEYLNLVEYIDENALWVPSANPISKDIGKTSMAAKSFFDRQGWRELAEYATSRMQNRPYESALAGFIMLTIVVVTRRLKGSA